MKLALEFVHWGYQCPWCEKSMKTIEKYSREMKIDYVLKNATSESKCSSLLSSFVTTVNNGVSTGCPIMEKNWKYLYEKPIRKEAAIEQEKTEGTLNEIRIIDEVTINDSIAICNNYSNEKSKKEEWFRSNKDIYYGYVGYINNKPVCMIEMTNSEDCPYDCIEKRYDIVQIICVYSNHDIYDYKRDLLLFVENQMKQKFRKIQIIVGENTRFPNGTKSLFDSAGYFVVKEISQTYILGKGYDRLFLMQKELS